MHKRGTCVKVDKFHADVGKKSQMLLNICV